MSQMQESLGEVEPFTVADVRWAEEQVTADLACLAAYLDGDLIDEHDVLDGELVSAAAEADRYAASYTGRLTSLLDDVAQDEAALAMQAAQRAKSVEQARTWAMISDELVLPDPKMTPAKREEWAIRTFESEVAARLHLPQVTAIRLIADSRTLVRELPRTLDALGAARISYRHAQVLIEQARTLPESARAGFEEAVLDAAVRLSVSQFRKMAIRAREALHPESITVRALKARADRALVLEADNDGMGWLHLYLPIAEAQAAYARITALAESLRGDGETRTLPQRRSDVAAELLLDGAVVEPADMKGASTAKGGKAKQPRWGIRPTVFVTVPVMTLLGGEEPGQLDGYGPIDPDTARRLAAKAPSFIRLLTHPETGIVLSMGRKRYKVPKDLRLWLKMRDGNCRKPFCNQPASVSHLDHTLAWGHGGPTVDSNLASLCASCHEMKHLTTWRVEQLGGGVLRWTSPLGQVHITRPAVEFPGTGLAAGGPGGGPPGSAPSTGSPPEESPPAVTAPDPAAEEPPPF